MQNDKAKFKNDFYERLIAFSLSVIDMCGHIRRDRNLWPVADQIIRSATSVGANVVEAKASSSRREYIKYFEIALKSGNETIYWLMIIRESCPNIEKKAVGLLEECDEINKIIGSSVLTLKGKK